MTDYYKRTTPYTRIDMIEENQELVESYGYSLDGPGMLGSVLAIDPDTNLVYTLTAPEQFEDTFTEFPNGGWQLDRLYTLGLTEDPDVVEALSPYHMREWQGTPTEFARLYALVPEDV
jgi:hypothetical protein